MTKTLLLPLFLLAGWTGLAQPHEPKDSTQLAYFEQQRQLGGTLLNQYFYPNFVRLHSLPENQYLHQLDSLATPFTNLLENYRNRLPARILEDERLGLAYFFDRLLLEYPEHHWIYTGHPVRFSASTAQRLASHQADFSQARFLANADFRNYLISFVSQGVRTLIRAGQLGQSDNLELTAAWQVISKQFATPAVRDFLRGDFLYRHIDNNGTKNIASQYQEFLHSCQDPEAVKRVRQLMDSEQKGREGHLIQTYKTVDGFNLEAHVFQSAQPSARKKPALVFFHGGSWSEGKPDWFFGQCQELARQGWVAVAIEYRTYGRYGTLPFQAVKDARSAIRWLRKNDRSLGIDTSRIVAAGNSAGGHLVLATALARQWNEVGDDAAISPVPNLLLVTAGVFDLTDVTTQWISRDLENKNLVQEISPNHLLQNRLPPTLLIHGTRDGNVPFQTAAYFAGETKKRGRDVTFRPIEDGEHFLWFGKHAAAVSEIQTRFLKERGYP